MARRVGLLVAASVTGRGPDFKEPTSSGFSIAQALGTLAEASESAYRA